MTWYITIRSDPQYSKEADAEKLTEFLQTIDELRATSAVSFESTQEQPWMTLIMAKADARGNYSLQREFLPKVSVVELVCAREESEWYDSLAKRIAAFLNWQAMELHEDRQIWPLTR